MVRAISASDTGVTATAVVWISVCARRVAVTTTSSSFWARAAVALAANAAAATKRQARRILGLCKAPR